MDDLMSTAAETIQEAVIRTSLAMTMVDRDAELMKRVSRTER
jgi:hypothetical protein